MTERSFRLLIGVWLVVVLLTDHTLGLYVLITVLLLEGITNWRIPMLISRYRYGADQPPGPDQHECVIPFEAERALRLIIVLFLAVAVLLAEWMWWISWMVGFALIGAGLSGICPMVMALRWVGMR